ncbi:MAG: serine/threonine protein phosphatase [Bacteroidales bacterium 36-12]|nr:MAG: serine/threonine protein phosphatase [Bacteroidales bacterium 36-12]
MNKILRITAISFLLFFGLQNVLAQKDGFIPPKSDNPDSWSMILLPDPQTYMKYDYNQPLFDLMLAWITRSQEALNTQLVLCTGDIVDMNDYLNPDYIHFNQSSKAQWEAAARLFGRLDGKIPYISTTGNHDIGFGNAENRYSNYDQYFPVDKNWKSQRMLKDVGRDINGKPSLTNATYEFISTHGKKFLVLVLEFAPRDETLVWAKNTIDKPKYADHSVILLIHSYLGSNNKHIETEGYPIEGANYGKAVWEKLVKSSKNIEMVFSGHIGVANDERAHVGFRTDINAGGRKVNQMTFNAQALGGGWHGNGGDGWLRILEFLPDGRTVKVKTFSPLFAASPTTQKYAWRTESYDEFTFTLDER